MKIDIMPYEDMWYITIQRRSFRIYVLKNSNIPIRVKDISKNLCNGQMLYASKEEAGERLEKWLETLSDEELAEYIAERMLE